MSGASSPGKAQTGISAEADVFLEVGYPVTGSGGLEGGALDWRERRDSGWTSVAFCLSLIASFWEMPLPQACGPVGCPSRRLLPIDQQGRDPSGAKQNALKGIDMAWLPLGSGIWSTPGSLEGLGESLMPHTAVCLRKKPSQTREDQKGILAAMLDFLDQLDLKQTLLISPHSSHTSPFC